MRAAASEAIQVASYKAIDVSQKESYDLLAIAEHETLKVEVKGTTGGSESILLTGNEVKLHQSSYPLNALVLCPRN